MGLMSPELFNAIQRGDPVYPILELDIGNTTLRYGAAPVDVDTLGMYEEKLLSWSAATSGASLTGLSLQGLNAAVEIDDQQRELDRIVTGESGRSIAGGSARAKLVSPVVAAASYFTFYAGVIKDYRKSGPKRYAVNLTTLDEPLNGRIKTPTLSKWDFPNAEDKDRDIPVPLVFGEHDAALVGGPVGGMIPCVRIGDAAGDLSYLVGHGRCDEVPAIYVDGVADGGAARDKHVINGRQYEIVGSFTSPPAVGAVVTVDCDGITDTGGAGGAVIKNPAEQLKQILAHWVFDEIQSPTNNMAIPAGTPIDITSFDAAGNFFDIHSIEGSRHLKGTETGMSMLNEFCVNFNAVPYWNHSGELAIAINDWFVDDIYDAAGSLPTFTHDDELGEFQYIWDTEILADEISVEFLYSSADSKFFRTIRVVDTLRGINSKEPRQLFWSSAK